MNSMNTISKLIKTHLTNSIREGNLSLTKVSVKQSRATASLFVVLFPSFPVMNGDYLNGVEGALKFNDEARAIIETVKAICVTVQEDLHVSVDYDKKLQSLEKELHRLRNELRELELESIARDQAQLNANVAKLVASMKGE